MPTITIDIPAGVSMYQLAAAARQVEFAAEAAIGVRCETNIDLSGAVRDTRDLTRRQELAADAMASKHGRSRIRRLSDGAVEITGMLDDVERETVCIEPDGRERWRR